MLTRAPSFILLLLGNELQIWQRKRQTAEHVASFPADIDDLYRQLQTTFRTFKCRALSVILASADIQLKHEVLPKASWLDQRKMIARRLDHLFKSYMFRHAQTGKSAETLFVGIRATPTLRAIIRAADDNDTIIHNVSHIAFELPRVTAQANRQVIVAQCQSYALLAAYQHGQPYLYRLLPAPIDVATEIEAIYKYMQRHEWSASNNFDITFLGYDLTRKAIGNVPAAAVTSQPHRQLDIDILARHFAGYKPAAKLHADALQKRAKLHTLHNTLRLAASAALLLAVSLWGLAYGEQHRLIASLPKLVQAQSMLPPPINLPDTQSLSLTDMADKHALPLLAKTMGDATSRMSLTLPTWSAPSSSAMIEITSSEPVPDNIDGWQVQAQERKATLQGKFGIAASAVEPRLFKFVGQP